MPSSAWLRLRMTGECASLIQDYFPMQFKFITLNLWNGGVLFSKALDFLSKEKPDILAVQEAVKGSRGQKESRFNSVETIKDRLGFKDHAFAPMFFNISSGQEGIWGNATFSRFPIKSEKTIFFDVSYQQYNLDELRKTPKKLEYVSRNMLVTEIKAEGKRLNVLNCHGIWGLNGQDNPRRLQMSAQIVEQLKGSTNVILAGDFNVQEKTRTIANIEKHLTNVFKNKLKTTFNMKRKDESGFATAVVDMIFVSPHIKIVDHYCPDVDVSDHLPLVCVLEF